MSYMDKLEKLITQKNGTLLTSDLKDLSIPRIYLSKLVDAGKLERVSRGCILSHLMQLKMKCIICSANILK